MALSISWFVFWLLCLPYAVPKQQRHTPLSSVCPRRRLPSVLDPPTLHACEPSKRVFFVPSTQSLADVWKELSPATYFTSCPKDPPLSNPHLCDRFGLPNPAQNCVGERQAHFMGNLLAPILPKIELILTSPFKRAIQTAVGLFEHQCNYTGPVEVNELCAEARSNLSDRVGVGHMPATLRSIVWAVAPEWVTHLQMDLSRLGRFEEDPWWDTSPAQVKRRAHQLSRYLVSRPEKTILVISHTSFLRHLLDESLDTEMGPKMAGYQWPHQYPNSRSASSTPSMSHHHRLYPFCGIERRPSALAMDPLPCQPAKRVIFIRHAQSIANAFALVDPVYYRKSSPRDSPISNPARCTQWRIPDPNHTRCVGEQQARAAGQTLPMDLIRNLDVLIVSPALRALQTAITMFANYSGPVEVNELCAEMTRSKSDFGQPLSVLRSLVMKEFAPDSWAQLRAHRFNWSRLERLSGGGPSGEEGAVWWDWTRQPFAQRVHEFQRYLARHPARTIAVVSHGTFLFALLDARIPNAGMIQFQWPDLAG